MSKLYFSKEIFNNQYPFIKEDNKSWVNKCNKQDVQKNVLFKDGLKFESLECHVEDYIFSICKSWCRPTRNKRLRALKKFNRKHGVR